MVRYWENHTDLVVGALDYSFFYRSTEAGVEPYVGAWLMVPNTEQVIFWQDYVDLLATGEIRAMWPAATAVTAVADIIRARSFHRFVFGGMFRRMN